MGESSGSLNLLSGPSCRNAGDIPRIHLPDVDLSGFIDELIQEEAATVQAKYATEFKPGEEAYLFAQRSAI